MKKKAEHPHQILLPLAGAAPHCFMVSDDELGETPRQDRIPELLEKAMAGGVSAQTLSRHREALLREAVITDNPDALALLMPKERRIALEKLTALFRLAFETPSPDAAAWLLQYRQEHYTPADLDRFEQLRMDRDLGLLEPDAGDLRKTFRLRYRAEGVSICGLRRQQHSYAVPLRIGEKKVIGVDPACFYPLNPMPRVTREFPAVEPPPSFAAAAAGDVLLLGRCPEKKGGAESPLSWRVLAREEGRLLALCERPVALLPYHPEQQEVTWESCALRRWLNTVFLPLCFTEAERSRILPCTVKTPASRNFGTPGGEATEDFLFLLSAEEAAALLPDASSRTLGRWWWLRTPGFDNSFAATVSPEGAVVSIGGFVDADDYAVRPAVWLRTE